MDKIDIRFKMATVNMLVGFRLHTQAIILLGVETVNISFSQISF